jgi:arylsulfatase A-like enzyme
MKLLVLHSSALHLGYLGCYGNEWVQTPHLDRLAAESVVFDQHFADCLGGRRTAWTGRVDFSTIDVDVKTSEEHDTAALALTCKRNKIPMQTVVTRPGQGRKVLVRVLDRLANDERWLAWIDLPALAPPWRIAHEFLECYFAQNTALESDEDDPSAEPEVEAPPLEPLLDPILGRVDVGDVSLVDRLQFTYAAAVTGLDALIGDLIAELEGRELLDEITLIVTADRGLALAEHGIVGEHRPWLHDEVVHLPLIVRLPEAREAGRRVAALTQPVDLHAALLDAVGIAAEAGAGLGLLPLALGQSSSIRDYALSGWALGDCLEWSLRSTEWAFLLPMRTPPGDVPRGPQLYVKPDDRWERNNLAHHHPEHAEKFETILRQSVADTEKE